MLQTTKYDFYQPSRNFGILKQTQSTWCRWKTKAEKSINIYIYNIFMKKGKVKMKKMKMKICNFLCNKGAVSNFTQEKLQSLLITNM